jgi:galactokinase
MKEELKKRALEEFKKAQGFDEQWDAMLKSEDLNFAHLVHEENEEFLKYMFALGYKSASVMYEVLQGKFERGELMKLSFDTLRELHNETTIKSIDKFCELACDKYRGND